MCLKTWATILLVFKEQMIGKKLIACIGDSITYGETLQERSLQSYPSQLAFLLGNGCEVRNLGKSGAGLWRGGFFPYTNTEEYHLALAMKADYYVVCLGTNDIVYGVNDCFLEAFKNDYLDLVGTFKSISPGARVIVCTLPPVPCMRDGGSDEAIGKLNDTIGRIAKANRFTLVDLHKPFLGNDNLFTDGVHPSVDGARLIAEKIYEAITGN